MHIIHAVCASHIWNYIPIYTFTENSKYAIYLYTLFFLISYMKCKIIFLIPLLVLLYLAAYAPLQQPEKKYIPDNYYYSQYNSSLTLHNLDIVLGDARIPAQYDPNSFDCSEGAAYMEWYLSNLGFDVAMIGNSKIHHAYIIVRFPDNSSYFVECIPPDNIRYLPTSPEYAYSDYDFLYEDIYAVGYYYEWNWWSSIR